MGSINILGIEGPKGAGKDTVFNMIKDMSPLPVKRFAFADNLKKELARDMKLDIKILHGTQEQKDQTLTQYNWEEPRFGWCRNGRKGPITYREMMTLWGRMKGTYYWLNSLFSEIYYHNTEHPEDIIIITDVRFDEEAKAIQAAGGSLLLVDGVVTGEHNDDPSEKGGLDYDFIVPGKGKAPKNQTRAELIDIMWAAFGINCKGR